MNISSLNIQKGINSDLHFSNRGGDSYEYALNAVFSEFNGEEYLIQNEPSNIICSILPPNKLVVGFKYILEQGRLILFLSDRPSFKVAPKCDEEDVFSKTGGEIGEILGYTFSDFGQNFKKLAGCDNCIETDYQESTPLELVPLKEKCTYKSLIKSDCLNFNINYPIDVEYKISDCSLQLYFVDNFNEDRFIYFDFLKDNPQSGLILQDRFKVVDSEEECCVTYKEELDCEKIKFNPNLNTPCIEVVDTPNNGALQAGSYQFFIAYSDALGNELSEYKAQTNPIPISSRRVTDIADYITSKAISLKVSNFDRKGAYQYYNLVALSTISNFKKAVLVGTFPITVQSYTYTGNEATQEISLDRLLANKVYYKKSTGVTKSNDYLFRFGLTEFNKPNLQRAASLVKLFWQTTSVPEDIYSEGKNTEKYKGYMRDEVYPFGIIFEYTNGEESNILHIPNYSESYYNNTYNFNLRQVVTNGDAIEEISDCSTAPINQYWKVYNTAKVIGGDYQQYDDCKETCWEWGDFAYWESEEKYPNNVEIWGDLCGKPIRYHKFPDNCVTHIHDSKDGVKSFDDRNKIYPLGVKIDHNSVKEALKIAVKECWITEEDYSRIKSYRIVRGDRVGNKSVVAKGLLYNVNEYVKDSKKYYYANYPYNDLSADSFLSGDKDIYKVSDSQPVIKLPFNKDTKKYTFHSPDIHFSEPTNATYLKLETEEYGKSEGWFDKAKQQSEYKFFTPFTVFYYTFMAQVSLLGFAGFPSTLEKFTDFLKQLETYRNLLLSYIPYNNFALQFNSIGVYNNYKCSAPTGFKQRKLEFYSFLNPDVEAIRVGNTSETFNNWQRESAGVLQTKGTPLKQTTTVDSSRYTASEVLSPSGNPAKYDYDDLKIKRYRNIASYYASVKNILPSQYGSVDGVRYLETGKCSYELDKDYSFSTVFGGDIFINRFALKRKHSFFRQTMFGLPNGTDVKYSSLANAAFPIYYFNSNNYGDVDYSSVDLPAFQNPTFNWFTGAPNFSNFGANFFQLILNGQKTVNVPRKRFDLDNTLTNNRTLYQTGFIYLYSYGIPYFLVESEVNVDFRTARNNKEGDFYPRVSDVSDWLQEEVVPPSANNTYYYNGDYSTGNIQTTSFFNSLIFRPNKVCKVEHPNRVIYSQQSTEISNADGLDRWLIHKASNSYDFKYTHGKLVSVEGIENDKVLVRLENITRLFNAYSTIQSDNGLVQIDNGGIFQSKPQEYATTDLGYFGTQNKAILKTEFGHITVDAKRGQIFVLGNNSSGLDEISKDGTFHWFKENLPFEIEKYFPDVDTDNNFKNIGLCLCFDKRFRRFLITKLDYKPLSEDIKYDVIRKEFYVINSNSQKEFISLSDNKYFCNKSWTRSFSFVSKTWTSFHSYTPSYYIDFVDTFSCGLNAVNYGLSSMWLHNMTNKSYQVFFGSLYPFIIETNAKYDGSNNYVTSIDYNVDVRRYHNERDYAYISYITYNKAILSNQNQTSGILKLDMVDKENLFEREKYPIKNLDSHSIAVEKTDNYSWSFNQFKDITKTHYSNQPLWLWNCANTFKYLNLGLLDYNTDVWDNYNKLLRKDDLKVTFINDIYSNYKFIHKFTVNNQTPSTH